MSKFLAMLDEELPIAVAAPKSHGYSLDAFEAHVAIDKINRGMRLSILRSDQIILPVAGFNPNEGGLTLLVRDGMPRSTVGDLLAWREAHGSRTLLTPMGKKISRIVQNSRTELLLVEA